MFGHPQPHACCFQPSPNSAETRLWLQCLQHTEASFLNRKPSSLTVRPWPIPKPRFPQIQGEGTWTVYGLNTYCWSPVLKAQVSKSWAHLTDPGPGTLPGPPVRMTHALSSLPGCFAEPGCCYRHHRPASGCQGSPLCCAPQSGRCLPVTFPPCPPQPLFRF